ncbi:MAG: transposase, partial [Verrucomicrobiota bacterium]
VDDADRQRFVETLGEVCANTGWQVHAYVLMPNHFHVVVETPQPNLIAEMNWLLGTHTSRFNRRHKLFGHLFSGRYKSLIVDGSSGGYLKSVGDYVHLNPARAKLVAADAPLKSFAWSSCPAWLRVDRLLGAWSIPKDSPAGRQRLAGLSLLGTLKVKNPSKRGVLRSKVCTTSGLATGRPVGS